MTAVLLMLMLMLMYATHARYVLRNDNYGVGLNYTWTVVPPHMNGLHGFVTSPTSKTLYGKWQTCQPKKGGRG